MGLFETDEAAFARVVPAVRPDVVVVTNLFRDQLDRYGEVDSVAAIWRSARWPALEHAPAPWRSTRTTPPWPPSPRRGRAPP